MPIICWGNLAKSADDTLRIEQSISEYVEGHDINPNAHQNPDSVLYMHRVNEILDHALGSVGLEHLASDKILMMTCFESVDGWSKLGSVSAFVLAGQVWTGNVNNDEAYAAADSGSGVYPLDFSKNPFFQTTVSFSAITSLLSYFGVGEWTGSGEGHAFGFKVSNATLYAVVRKAGNYYPTEIAGINTTIAHVYRAYYDSTAQKVYFYVDGVLKHTELTNIPSGTSSYYFTYYIKTLTAGYRGIIMVDLLFEQDR